MARVRNSQPRVTEWVASQPFDRCPSVITDAGPAKAAEKRKEAEPRKRQKRSSRKDDDEREEPFVLKCYDDLAVELLFSPAVSVPRYGPSCLRLGSTGDTSSISLFDGSVTNAEDVSRPPGGRWSRRSSSSLGGPSLAYNNAPSWAGSAGTGSSDQNQG